MLPPPRYSSTPSKDTHRMEQPPQPVIVTATCTAQLASRGQLALHLSATTRILCTALCTHHIKHGTCGFRSSQPWRRKA